MEEEIEVNGKKGKRTAQDIRKAQEIMIASLPAS
jgi:hypothetical protein